MKHLISLWIAASLLSGCGQRNEAEAPAESPAGAAVTPSATASAQLAPTEGNTANGSITLTPLENGVHLSGSILGLAPDGEFGFHIHEKGDCSAPDASSAGGHFNPANAQHGNPAGDTHHAGDMYNVKSDAQGVARIETQAPGATLGSGQPNDVSGKAVVLHEKADDFTTQPSGDSGARIACGVITSSS
jgi:Cu-Zn family superoxide dismutase